MSDSNSDDNKQHGDSQPIFRDEALAYISTPSDVNKVITVVGSGTWIIILTLVIAMIFGLGWLFYGSIPITLQGQGILIPKGGIFKTITYKMSEHGFRNLLQEYPSRRIDESMSKPPFDD